MLFSFKADRFGYDSEARVFFAEHSDLALRVGQWPRRFEIVNNKTGRAATFERGAMIPSDNGEFFGFVYTNSPHRCSAHIFND